ncbi:hypothetical protein NLS1_02180 [Nocardioides sp. LS1]|nr:hypothetical protein NLS1_02180 [Nocardioides sp. LS1]
MPNRTPGSAVIRDTDRTEVVREEVVTVVMAPCNAFTAPVGGLLTDP